MKILKILTLTTLTYLISTNYVSAEIEINPTSPNKQIMIGKMLMTERGLLLGENNNNFSLNPLQGLYLDKELDLLSTHQGMNGHRISNIIKYKENYFVSTITTVNGKVGIFRLDSNLSNPNHIGLLAAVTQIYIFQDRLYYGGDTIGLRSVKPDGSDDRLEFGGDTSGPKITFIGSNQRGLYFVANGSMYFINSQNGYLYNLISLVSPQTFMVFEDFIIASNKNKLYKINLEGMIVKEITFINTISYTTKYLDYIFIVEKGSSEQRISVSKDYGENYYKSKAVYTPSLTIKEIVFSGTKDIKLYVNFYNKGIYSGNFSFDFEEDRFLGIPFKSSKTSDLVDKISSFFDHRYPVLGNLAEPSDAKNKTMNYTGKELGEPFIYYSSHDGIDFALPMFTPIYAAEGGTATYIYNPGGLGHAFVIYHPNNYVTVYGHLDEKDLVTKGSITVTKGQMIGRIGMSGNTTGPHLHFVVYKGAKELQNKVDPFGWQGNFVDPWSVYNFNFQGKSLIGSASKYLWKDKVPYYSKVLSTSNLIEMDNHYLSFSSPSSQNTSVVTYAKTPPIYDQKNYLYRPNTSYTIDVNTPTNVDIKSSGIISFSGFSSYEDEKKYSIFKRDEERFNQEESYFDPQKNQLSAKTELNGDYLVLKQNLKKIKSVSSFKTQ